MNIRRRPRNRRRRDWEDGLRSSMALGVPLAHAITGLILPALLISSLSAASWAVWRYVQTTPYFRIHELVVDGLDRVGHRELLQRSGLSLHETHILDVEPAALAQLLEGHPWVATARVERKLPDRVHIRIIERKAEAVVTLGEPYLTDAYGNLFAQPRTVKDMDQPVVTGLGREVFLADRDEGRQRLIEALSVIREWKRQGLEEYDHISEVHQDPIMGITITTRRYGIAVRLGHRQVRARLARLGRVLEDLRLRSQLPSYVLLDDERDPGRVALRIDPTGTWSDSGEVEEEAAGKLARTVTTGPKALTGRSDGT